MSQYIIEAIQLGVLEALEMTFFSAFLGLPLGIILYATAQGKLLENRIVNLILGVIVNVLRSLPFLILLVLLILFTRLVTGSSIGTIASIVPLTIGTVPIVARMVEASLCEIRPGIIELQRLWEHHRCTLFCTLFCQKQRHHFCRELQ